MLLSFIVLVLTIYLAALIVPGISFKQPVAAIIVAVVLALLNAYVAPTLQGILAGYLIGLPLMTIGLIAFLINVIFILVAGALVSDFEVKGLGWAVVYAFVIALLTPVVEQVIQVIV